MNNIEIKYNQKQAKFGLIIGVLFLTLGIISLFYGSKPAYLSFVLGIVNLVIFFYKRSVNYMTVKDGFIMKDLGSKIPINEIIDTRRFARDYTFKSKTKKIVIDKNAVDKDSIKDIENFINDLRAGNL